MTTAAASGRVAYGINCPTNSLRINFSDSVQQKCKFSIERGPKRDNRSLVLLGSIDEYASLDIKDRVGSLAITIFDKYGNQVNAFSGTYEQDIVLTFSKRIGPPNHVYIKIPLEAFKGKDDTFTEFTEFLCDMVPSNNTTCFKIMKSPCSVIEDTDLPRRFFKIT